MVPLAELFRMEGYGGLAYKGKLTNEGFNVALFELDAARQVHGELRKVETMEFKFGEYPEDQYFVNDEGLCVRNIVTGLTALGERQQRPASEPGGAPDTPPTKTPASKPT